MWSYLHVLVLIHYEVVVHGYYPESLLGSHLGLQTHVHAETMQCYRLLIALLIEMELYLT